MSELKPCPFCGKKPNPNWTDESYIECTNRKCDIYSFGMSTGAWNTRPIEDALNARIAELERDVKWREESISTIEHALANNEDDIEMLESRIAELEGFIDRLIEVGDWLNAMHEDGVFVDELNAARTSWKLAVSDWQAMPFHVTNPLDSQGIVTRNGGEG